MVNHQTLMEEKNALIIKSLAKKLGFDFCGISKVTFLEEEAPLLEDWLKKNLHGQMAYMANHFDKRLDPRLLVEGTKSVVSLLYNYYPAQKLSEEAHDIKISKYAYGEDYHLVIRDKLSTFWQLMTQEIGAIEGRFFVDSAPVLEKAWAKKSGLGWLGKNVNLINKEQGSFFFIAELLINIPLKEDSPIADYCGTCTRCLDACPTDALFEPYKIDASRCISYLNIELKEAIPVEFQNQLGNWAFGCDICQDVCPWNRFSKTHQEPRFQLKQRIFEAQQNGFEELMTEDYEEAFKRIFGKSALKRKKSKGFVQTLRLLKNNLKSQQKTI